MSGLGYDGIAGLGPAAGAYYPGWLVMPRTYAANTAGAITANTLYAARIEVPQACSVDRFYCGITVLSGATSVARAGVYAAAPSGLPGTLILEGATTFDTSTGTGSTGVKFIPFATPLSAGSYWLALVAQGGSPSMTLQSGGGSGIAPDTSLVFTTVLEYPGVRCLGVSGALPSPFSALDYADVPPRMALRYV